MRLFIDTNVLVSTILFPASTSAAFVRAAVEAHALVISDYVVDELYAVIRRKFPTRIEAIDEFLREFPHERVSDAGTSVADELHELRDEADRPIIAAAISSHCERIITGDRDLLVLDRENLRIVSPGDFLRSTMAGAETE